MKNGTKSAKLEKTAFFFGEYEHSLDAQRRLAIPKIWRANGNASRFFLLPGRYKALQLIPFESFQELLTKARKIPFADASASLALARLGAMAQECRCDKQGRIAIPQLLMDYAALKEQVILVGALTTIQIWSPGNWKKLQTSDETVLDEIQKIGERPDSLSEILKGKA